LEEKYMRDEQRFTEVTANLRPPARQAAPVY
jgi:hypothetical protein